MVLLVSIAAAAAAVVLIFLISLLAPYLRQTKPGALIIGLLMAVVALVYRDIAILNNLEDYSLLVVTVGFFFAFRAGMERRSNNK